MADISWQRVEPTVVNKIGWRTVVSKTFVQPDGRTQDYQAYDKEGQRYANVIALTDDNQVILARQFRCGPERIMEEIPGGYVDAGEEPQAAAVRELREETGYQAGQVTDLGIIYPDGFSNAVRHSYLAVGCQRVGAQQLEASEHIEVVLVSIAQLMTNARLGRMCDVGAVLLAYDHLIKMAGTGPRR